MKGTKPILEIDNRQRIVDYDEELIELLENCIEKVLGVLNVTTKTTVSVVLVDNEGIQSINREFRGIDKETDVLSFPMMEINPSDNKICLDEHAENLDPETMAVVLGDIVLSLEKAREQAQVYGHTFGREVGFLTTHGMLHLLGYDHIREEDARLMRKREEEILSELGLART